MAPLIKVALVKALIMVPSAGFFRAGPFFSEISFGRTSSSALAFSLAASASLIFYSAVHKHFPGHLLFLIKIEIVPDLLSPAEENVIEQQESIIELFLFQRQFQHLCHWGW